MVDHDRSTQTRQEQMSSSENRRRIMGIVRRHVGSDSFGPMVPFRKMGISRERATQFREELGAELGLTLPATVLFDYPHPKALTEYLAGGPATRAKPLT